MTCNNVPCAFNGMLNWNIGIEKGEKKECGRF